MAIEQYSKEMYDLLDFFERSVGKVAYAGGDFSREPKESWLKGYYYRNGTINTYFRVFMCGYTFGKSLCQDEQ